MDDAKDCPRCGLVNPPSAQRCDCGYDFETRQVLGTYLSDKDLVRAAEDAEAHRDQDRVLGWIVGGPTLGLFGAVKQLADTADALPPASDPANLEAQRHAQYHKWIVLVGGLFAAVGLVVGVITLVVMASEERSGPDVRGIILSPVLYGAGGFVFGMALMCLVAPRAFLTGPVGAPWMKLIGTQSVIVARIVCILLGLVVTIPLVGIGLLIALSK